MRVALQDVIIHIVKRYTEGTGREQIIRACTNHENVSACNIRSICTEMQCLITASISSIFIKGCARYAKKIHLQGSVKLSRKYRKLNRDTWWGTGVSYTILDLQITVTKYFQPFPQTPSSLSNSHPYLSFLSAPVPLFIDSYLGKKKRCVCFLFVFVFLSLSFCLCLCLCLTLGGEI
jgi:hypothetical protein